MPDQDLSASTVRLPFYRRVTGAGIVILPEHRKGNHTFPVGAHGERRISKIVISQGKITLLLDLAFNLTRTVDLWRNREPGNARLELAIDPDAQCLWRPRACR